MLLVALHGTTMHFCCRELVFSHVNAVPHYRLTFLNEVANSDVSMQNACALLYTYSHPMVTLKGTCHRLSNVYVLFPA
jgi:hypothetical protein